MDRIAQRNSLCIFIKGIKLSFLEPNWKSSGMEDGWKQGLLLPGIVSSAFKAPRRNRATSTEPSAPSIDSNYHNPRQPSF